MTNEHFQFMRRAIRLAQEGMENQVGGPFGAVIVRKGLIIAEGQNRVTSTNDPTAHAEVVAIRNACSTLGSFQLDDCVVYTSCEPCPMCLGAIYWSRAKAIYYGCSRKDAALIGFDDQFIYDEIAKDLPQREIDIINILPEEAWKVFKYWDGMENKREY